MTDRYLKGWEQIEALFPMYAPGTVRKKYGKEMLENGWIMKSHEAVPVKGGYKRRPIVWSYESIVKAFISKKQYNKGKV